MSDSGSRFPALLYLSEKISELYHLPGERANKQFVIVRPMPSHINAKECDVQHDS